MAKGQKTGGRKKGSRNKRTAAMLDAVVKSGITPLDYMLEVMRKPIPEDAEPQVKAVMIGQRFEAAKAAAPYVHNRLSSIEHAGKGGGPIKAVVELKFV